MWKKHSHCCHQHSILLPFSLHGFLFSILLVHYATQALQVNTIGTSSLFPVLVFFFFFYVHCFHPTLPHGFCDSFHFQSFWLRLKVLKTHIARSSLCVLLVLTLLIFTGTSYPFPVSKLLKLTGVSACT